MRCSGVQTARGAIRTLPGRMPCHSCPACVARIKHWGVKWAWMSMLRIYPPDVVESLVLLPEEYLHHRREYRIRINVVLVVQLVEGAGLTKMYDPEGFQRSVEESPEPGECEGMTI
jgi:hypothetical protein